MTRPSPAATTSFLVGLLLTVSHPALAAAPPHPATLSDAHLDTIAAGSEARVKGDASAVGDAARSGASASSQIGGGFVGMAVGSAAASATGANAVASSTLVLSLTIR